MAHGVMPAVPLVTAGGPRPSSALGRPGSLAERGKDTSTKGAARGRTFFLKR